MPDRMNVSREDLRRMYCDESLSLVAMGARLGVSASTVQNWLSAHEIPRRQPGARPITVDLARAQSLYDKGLTLMEVATELGVCHTTVRKDLRRKGVRLRHPGTGRPEIDSSELARLYAEGMSLAEIGERVGITQSKVAARIRKVAGALRRPCADCGVEMTKGGAKMAARCKPCAREHRRHQKFQALYGLAIGQASQMLADQSGACAVCRRRIIFGGKSRRKAVVDHCHATGAVRGLLCHHCNVGLGVFADDPEHLRSAAAYIERHRA